MTCHRGLALLLRIRQLTAQRNEDEFTFARTFASEWCGVTRDQARYGIEGLIRLEVLVKVGEIRITAKRAATLYRLGSHASVKP